MKVFKLKLLTSVAVTGLALAGAAEALGQTAAAGDSARGMVGSYPRADREERSPAHGLQTSDGLPLSLSEAIRRAMESNNELVVARADLGIARNSLRSLLGGYDPVITLSPRYSNNTQPQPSTLGGADLSGVTRSKEFRFDTALRQAVRATGGDLNVAFNNNRQETSSLFSQLNPTFSSTLGFTYTQPLLRNLEIDSSRRQIRVQRKRVGQSEFDFQRSATETVNQVQRAYWDLVFALRDQQNRISNLNLSKENLRQIEARIAAGAAAPLQRAEIETELANRESEVLLATQQVTAAENTLKRLILPDAGSREWGQAIIPTDRPAIGTESQDLDSALAEAVSNRFELKRLKLQREIVDIETRFRRNQIRPQVDLTAGYTHIGLSGSLVGAPGAVPPRFVGGYGQALDNLSSGDTRAITFGLTISIPVTNRSARAELANAELQGKQIDAQLRSQEQTVISEIRNAVLAVETARQRVAAARRGRDSAEIQLEGERKLFEVGRSTQFLLFQRENSLTNARNAEVRAETDYSKAVADLQKATATTLVKNGIELSEQ
jgi:HAE1 family hydrophobic/amphiphilic exporter-1